MALATQAHPFYYPPHAPFIFHGHLQRAPLPHPPPPPPPSSSSITAAMALAPPFVPHASPRPQVTDAALQLPLLPAAPASFFLHSVHQTPVPPTPAVPSPALLPQLPPGFHGVPAEPFYPSYFFYQSPLAPGFFPAPALPVPLYYPAAAPPIGGQEAAGGELLSQLGRGGKPTCKGGDGGNVAVGRRTGGAAPCPARWGGPRKSGLLWVPKGEAEKRRQLGSINVGRSPTMSSSSSTSPSSTDSPSASTFSASSADSPAAPFLTLEFDGAHSDLGTRTTVMIKNIPNRYSRELLLKLLDDHCVEENQKLEPAAPPSEYNFVYLPMDFRYNACLGYAFVNFSTPAAAWRFYRARNSHSWGAFETKKISHVCYARIQGKEALLANFCASSFKCDSDEFLPVTFSPPRSGAPPCTPPTLVGKRWPRGTNMPTAAGAATAAAAAACCDSSGTFGYL